MKLCVIIATIAWLGMSTSCSSDSLPNVTPTAAIAPNVGRVVGSLQVRSGESVEPVKSIFLYLASTIKDTTGRDTLLSFDRINSPRAITDSHGAFVFSDIPPGNYGLVLDTVTNSFLLKKPDADEILMIEVSAGEQTDLDTLLYDSLPLISRPKSSPYP